MPKHSANRIEKYLVVRQGSVASVGSVGSVVRAVRAGSVVRSARK
ncbi:MAG: hypothetical protein SWX82_32520 [Cyanobacteriota bacterium]|nr:hypothetical protein [Cyanobacteriota bacterium]